jgi:hypothetical protein
MENLPCQARISKRTLRTCMSFLGLTVINTLTHGVSITQKTAYFNGKSLLMRVVRIPYTYQLLQGSDVVHCGTGKYSHKTRSYRIIRNLPLVVLIELFHKDLSSKNKDLPFLTLPLTLGTSVSILGAENSTPKYWKTLQEKPPHLPKLTHPHPLPYTGSQLLCLTPTAS